MQPTLDPTLESVPDLLRAHLEEDVGAWPPAVPVRVARNPRRAEPGWDGHVSPVSGIVLPTGAAAVGMPPDAAARVPDGVLLDDLLAALPDLLDLPGRAFRGVFRWSTDPTPGPDDGLWLPVDDPRVPAWLHPFGGEVLVALENDRYLAGVGIKNHDRYGREIAVGTEERARGRGLARRLVAQAARRILDQGSVPTYKHDPLNVASGKVADAAGFPDRGWQVVGFFAGRPR